MKEVLYQNANTGVTQFWHEDAEGNVTLQTQRNETQIFDDNQSIHNMSSTLDRWGDGKICLRGVPLTLVDQWKRKGLFTKENFWRVLQSDEAKPYIVFGKR